MTLAPGMKLGSYEIVALLGAGGMGEVYRARDTRLDRIVAIKVLPSHLSSNTDLKQRFVREARTISNLSHSHICVLHDIGHQDGIDFLVMEYLEGETLAARLRKGAVSTDLALRYGIEMADALDKAHRQGIVHRDFKPGNIMLTKSGVKLLDFGLAKLQKIAEETSSSVSALATEERDLTLEGTIMGTLQYMSPEQLEGKETDSRTDVFAFGTVLYEMVTGKKAFEGKSQASLIAAILKEEPRAISTLQPMSPPTLDRVIRKCLAKDPDDRWQSAGDLKSELQWIAEFGSQTGVTATARSKNRTRLVWGLMALLSLLAFGIAAWAVRQKEYIPQQVMRFTVSPPPGTILGNRQAISPDGTQIAFLTSNPGIYVRRIDSMESRIVKGTEQAVSFFWGPDSRSIAFFTPNQLAKVGIENGIVQRICDVPFGELFWRSGDWNADGMIAFLNARGIYKVPSSGGKSTLLIKFLVDFSYPLELRFFPKGDRFLYTLWGQDPSQDGIYVGFMDGSSPKRIWHGSAREAVPLEDRSLLFLLDNGQLLLQSFDESSNELSSTPVLIASEVIDSISLSSTGILSYISGSRKEKIAWFDRSGNRLEMIGKFVHSSPLNQITISPDGVQAALSQVDPLNGNVNLWLADLKSGAFSQLTDDPGNEFDPFWLPDGRSIVFGTAKKDTVHFYLMNIETDVRTPLLESDGAKYISDCSKDGRFVVFQSNESRDIWILSLNGEHPPELYLHSDHAKDQIRISHDSRWLAYESLEKGTWDIYVDSLPKPIARVKISGEGGGRQPVWRADGKELFYLTGDAKLMVVPIQAENKFQPGVPKELFRLPLSEVSYAVEQYDVTADGQRFIAIVPEENVPRSLQVVVNWQGSVKQPSSN